MGLTASELRANIYRLLDQVLDTGVPIDIQRRGRTLRIIIVEHAGALEQLEPHPDYIRGDPDDLVHLDWSDQWKP